jgi:hypothetical protein
MRYTGRFGDAVQHGVIKFKHFTFALSEGDAGSVGVQGDLADGISAEPRRVTHKHN